MLLGALPAALAAADPGATDTRPVESSSVGKSKKSVGTPRKQPAGKRLPGSATPAKYRPLGLDYPSDWPELTPAQKFEFETKLALVPADLRGTMMVYVLHDVAPEYFKPGVLLAPNPMAAGKG
jgi:hypothetical protein